MLRIVTVNVNGIRAAVRRGMGAWLADRRPDVLCLQEVRAPDEILRDLLGAGWHGVHEEATAKGRSGVAVLARTAPLAVRAGFGHPPADSPGDGHAVSPGAGEFAGTGRWVEADLAVAGDPGLLTVVSVYVPKGEAGTARQEEKYRFLAAAGSRARALADDGRHVLVCGDLNIAHTEADLRNWKGNVGKAGFLPAERAWLDGLLGADGLVDVHRAVVGAGPGPYTWWSWRGKAFDTDSGWRIDHQLATPGLAALAVKAEVDRAPSYAARWSDHAPVLVDYDLTGSPSAATGAATGAA